MKAEAKHIPHSLVLLGVILICLIALLSAVQPSLARYTSAFDGTVHFTVSAKSVPRVATDEWAKEAGGSVLPFGVTAEDTVRLRVFLPAGTTPGIVFLTLGEKKYTAVVTPLSEGSAARLTLGAGSVCLFYDERGRELACDASGGIFATLTLSGDGIATEGVRVLAEPAKNN